MKITTFTALVLVEAVVVSGTYSFGFVQGRASFRAAYSEASRMKDLSRQILQQQRDALARKFEDAAREEPASDNACLPLSRVLRLRDRTSAMPRPGGNPP